MNLKDIKRLYTYNPEEGIFRYKYSRGKCRIHQEAGTSYSTYKYRKIQVGQLIIDAHRLAIWWVEGEYPTTEDWPHIDHLDGDGDNNKYLNLKKCKSNSENSKNSKMYTTNTSGVTGVSWQRNTHKWFAYIWDKGKRINLGYYEDLEEATTVRIAAEKRLGYTDRHGSKETK